MRYITFIVITLYFAPAWGGYSPEELKVIAPATLCKEQQRLSEQLGQSRYHRILYSKKRLVKKLEPINAAIEERGIECSTQVVASTEQHCRTRVDPYGNIRTFCEQ